MFPFDDVIMIIYQETRNLFANFILNTHWFVVAWVDVYRIFLSPWEVLQTYAISSPCISVIVKGNDKNIWSPSTAFYRQNVLRSGIASSCPR